MAPITVVALSTSFWGSKLSLPTGTCTRLVLSARNSTLPALISFTAAATSRVTVPVLGLGLTYRSPTSDQTRSRWALAPERPQVEEATLGEQAVGLERCVAGGATYIQKLLPGLTD